MAEKLIAQKVNTEYSYGLLNRGVCRVFSVDEPVHPKREKMLQEVFYLDENGDARPKTEFVNPPQHPLDGLVYSSETMSLTSLLNAGVVLKPATLNPFAGDPSAAERAAVANFATLVHVDEPTSVPTSEPTPEPTSELTSEPSNN